MREFNLEDRLVQKLKEQATKINEVRRRPLYKIILKFNDNGSVEWQPIPRSE